MGNVQTTAGGTLLALLLLLLVGIHVVCFFLMYRTVSSGWLNGGRQRRGRRSRRVWMLVRGMR